MNILDLRQQLIKRKDEICQLIEYNNAMLKEMEHEKKPIQKTPLPQPRCATGQMLQNTMATQNHCSPK